MSHFSAMRLGDRPISFWRGFLIACFFLAAISSARAAITPTGDVDPSNPSTWDSSTTGYIGNTASGTLTVDGGSILYSYDAYIGNSGSGSLSITGGGSVSDCYGFIGCSPGSSGTVTVSGSGSTWNSSQDLFLGYLGNGTLAINGGGAVTVARTTYVAYAGT
jgi:T5SS/PEP-CTERM-associated repeat protein